MIFCLLPPPHFEPCPLLNPNHRRHSTARWKGGIIPPLHEWPPSGGSHGKPHRTTQILSHVQRRGGRVAACCARAALHEGRSYRNLGPHPRCCVGRSNRGTTGALA